MYNVIAYLVLVSGMYIAAMLARFLINSKGNITANTDYRFDEAAEKKFDRLILASLIFFVVGVAFFIFISRHTKSYISILTSVCMAIIGFLLLKINALMKNH